MKRAALIALLCAPAGAQITAALHPYLTDGWPRLPAGLAVGYYDGDEDVSVGLHANSDGLRPRVRSCWL